MNDDIKFMKIALEEAQKAFKKGEIPVGAVIVKDGIIVSKAHNLKETKNFSKTKDVISKNNSKTEIELITAYAQLAFHTLKNSNTDITAKSIKEEVTMFYEKFGNTEVKRLANIIMKEKKEKK